MTHLDRPAGSPSAVAPTDDDEGSRDGLPSRAQSHRQSVIYLETASLDPGLQTIALTHLHEHRRHLPCLRPPRDGLHPRSTIDDDPEVSVGLDQDILEVVNPFRRNFQTLEDHVAGQGPSVTRRGGLSDGDGSHGAEKDHAMAAGLPDKPVPAHRLDSDPWQVRPDLLSMADVGLGHPLPQPL
jgi:hypothetical protein